MNTKLILTLLATVFASVLATPTKSEAGSPYYSSGCRQNYQPRCYSSQPSYYYQPSCQTYRPVQYYQPQCSQQYYPQQYYGSGQYYPQQYSSGQCYQQQYRPPVVVQVYHPPVVTTVTRIIWQSRPTQPSCQNGRCSSR